MQARSWSKRVLLALVLLLPAGCVELTGQRISWCYDQAKDELRILIHYDGIHNADRGENGADQIPKFIRDGDIMLADWFGRIEMRELRARAEDPQADPYARDRGRLLQSLRVEPVGYYVEPDGRIGAAQMVIVPNASDFIRRFNDLINRGAATAKLPDDSPLRETLVRQQAAAKLNHQWIELKGQTFRLTLPVDPAEWARARASAIAALADAIADRSSKDDQDKARIGRLTLALLAAGPWSYIDEGRQVTIVVGHADASHTWRLPIREEYGPGLEGAVKESVKTDLDRALARLLLDGQEHQKTPEAPAAVLRWGPPEDAVRALMAVARDADEQKADAAVKRLQRFAAEWSQSHRLPTAPPWSSQREVYLSAWKAWYAQMKQYPLVPSE